MIYTKSGWKSFLRCYSNSPVTGPAVSGKVTALTSTQFPWAPWWSSTFPKYLLDEPWHSSSTSKKLQWLSKDCTHGECEQQPAWQQVWSTLGTSMIRKFVQNCLNWKSLFLMLLSTTDLSLWLQYWVNHIMSPCLLGEITARRLREFGVWYKLKTRLSLEKISWDEQISGKPWATPQVLWSARHTQHHGHTYTDSTLPSGRNPAQTLPSVSVSKETELSIMNAIWSSSDILKFRNCGMRKTQLLAK